MSILDSDGTLPQDISMCALFPEELTKRSSISPAFRGRQLFEWIHKKGVLNFDEMTNIPVFMRSELIKAYGSPLSSRIEEVREDSDGTVKVIIQLHDSRRVESVLLTDENGRKTACLSSQVGCALGCTFCRTGLMGLIRNLTAGEILEQYLHLRARYGAISHVVFMGMGEPLMNLPELLRAIRIFHQPGGINLGMRKITISTSGIAAGIHELCDAGIPVRLAVSLITADQALREELMPVAQSVSLKSLQQALIRFQEFHNKRITLEYVVFKGINTRDIDIDSLEAFIRPLEAIVNIIPWNPVEGLPFEEAPEYEIQRFVRKLAERKIPATRRYRRGRGIQGACGQLATENPTEPSKPEYGLP